MFIIINHISDNRFFFPVTSKPFMFVKQVCDTHDLLFIIMVQVDCI